MFNPKETNLTEDLKSNVNNTKKSIKKFYKRNVFNMAALLVYTAVVVGISALVFLPKQSSAVACNDVLPTTTPTVVVNETHVDKLLATENNMPEMVPVDEVTFNEALITAEEPAEVEVVSHTIVEGDCFWNIAQFYYGDGSLCDKLAAANNMNASDNIYSGMVITIPENLDDADVIKPEDRPAVEVSTPSSDSYDPEDGLSKVFNATTIEDYSNLEYYGACNITGYTPWCAHCCGKTDGITRSGKQAVVGVTAGMVGLPLGTEIYIEGYGYFTVQDTGNVNNYWVDLACYSHEDCYKVTGYAKVYIVK